MRSIAFAHARIDSSQQRPTLVEPYVLPRGQGHAVAIPLVGGLVDHHGVAADRVGEEVLEVDRAGLDLQREEQVVGVVDDAAAGGERVGPEPLGGAFGLADHVGAVVGVDPAVGQRLLRDGQSIWVLVCRRSGPRW
jgi:hypothetical protein